MNRVVAASTGLADGNLLSFLLQKNTFVVRWHDLHALTEERVPVCQHFSGDITTGVGLEASD